MAIAKGIFGWSSAFEERFIEDYDRLGGLVEHLKGLDLKVVLTMGVWDIAHLPHFDYLEAARGHGDVLIVGVDSDEKVRARKGPDRPAVPQDQRLRTLSHLRSVDVITLKNLDDPKWHLVKTVRPDVLIATDEEGSYTPEQMAELEAELCGQVIKLPRMGEVTTTTRLRDLRLGGAKELSEHVAKAIQDYLEGTK